VLGLFKAIEQNKKLQVKKMWEGRIGRGMCV